MAGRTRIAPAAAAAALAFLAAGCSSPGTPITGPTENGFTHSKSPDARPSRTKHPAPALHNPFKNAGLISFLASRQGVVTAALYDKNTNQLWQYNKGKLEYTASIVKVEILGTALWEVRSADGQLP